MSPNVHEPLYINDELVECVTEYKYLGTLIDNKFNFNANVEAVYRKANSRLYFFRKLSKLKVDHKIMELFYTSIVQSVISFAIVCWYGNCNCSAKHKLERVIKTCSKLGVLNAVSLMDLFKKSTIQRCKIITEDAMHPLNSCYQRLPSGRRLRSVKSKTTRYSNSFVPTSIRLLNEI